MSMKWRHVAILFPEFVQWVIRVHGPLPEEFTEDDYTKYASEWLTRSR